MTLLHAHAFNNLATADLADKYFTASAGATVSTTEIHNGRQSLRLGGQGHNIALTFADTSSIVLSGYLFITDFIVDSGREIFDFSNAGNNQIRFQISGIFPWHVTALRAGSAFVGQSIIPFMGKMWNHFSLKLTISNSIAADSCILKINGDEALNLPAGTDTQGQANSTINRVILMTSNTYFYFDEIVLFNQSGTTNNDLLAPGHRIATLQPNGNGNSSDFVGSDGNSTDNYLLVDEDDPDDDTTYTESAVVNDLDLYTYENMPETPASILGVQINSYAKKTDAGARNIRNIIRSNSINYDGSTGEHTLATGYDYYEDIEEVNPNTAVAWTEANLNSAEFGVEVST